MESPKYNIIGNKIVSISFYYLHPKKPHYNITMENYEETLSQYRHSLKKAKKCYHQCLKEKKSPFLASLDEVTDIYQCSSQYIGEIDVPEELIIGTWTAIRKKSFAANFLPLLKVGSEFCYKWRNVCAYHLSDTGISEPPTAFEYLGKFYIKEGNKRVSVLKSYGAPFITLNVTRLIPENKNTREYRNYEQFLKLYSLSKLYTLQFTKIENYTKILEYMGFSNDYVWERMDRIHLIGFYGRLVRELKKKKVTFNYCDCLVAMMELYGYQNLIEMKDNELSHCVNENLTRLNYGKGYYNIQCISDEENTALYSGCAKSQLKDIDFILSCGDLKSEYLEYLVTISNKPLFYIHGNHDSRYDSKPPEGCVCIDDDLVIYQGIRIAGIGGSLRYSLDKYQYTELEMEKRLRKLKRKIRKAGGVDIIISHAPIQGYGDLEDYAHRGFDCFVSFLYEFHPKFWFYGHVHASYCYNLQRERTYKNTKIINVSNRYEVKY